jgi:hypothetical protein
MIFFVSPDRRDDKYLFMLLPVLLLLGAQGLALIGHQLLALTPKPLLARLRLSPPHHHDLPSKSRLSTLHAKRPISTRSVQSPITTLTPLAVCALISLAAWPQTQALLANTGDDYDSAFAYVRQHWQAGDTILTGTPAAAAFYLGRNDFYSVQRRGGYDYRILTGAAGAEPVDRWLASPAIRTEASLHQTLANHKVWLVLERWGLQREYYDLPFQQQLLAQTEYVTEAQGIFILRSKVDPQPIALAPARLVYHPDSESHPTFGDKVQLIGYTVEPDRLEPGQSLRLTLYWQALAPLPHDYTVFVHLRDAETGGNVAQADHRPLGELYPTSLWPVAELIRETSDLPAPATLAPGAYDLWVGLYLLETGERLPVQADSSGENAVRLGSITVRPPG